MLDRCGRYNVLFSNATLLPGDTITLTIAGTIAPGTTGNLANSATVTAGPGANEANTANNSATDTDTQGTSIADLAASKTNGQTTYVAGTAINYTITVTNAGPSTAAGFWLKDVVARLDRRHDRHLRGDGNGDVRHQRIER